MRILVTAFDPFGGEVMNPAQMAVERLADRIGNHDITKLIVPTVFGVSGDQVTAEMDRLKPDAVISVGQAGGRKAVTPERVAIDIMDANITDNAGIQPKDEPVVEGGPAAYFSTLPVKTMVESIKAAGLPAQISNTAGTFVCNHLLYRVLHHAAQRMPHTKCCFVHVPYITEQVREKPDMPSMELEDIVRALTAAIEGL